MITDLPYKILNSLVVNSVLYFMANLRREAGPFFFFWLIAFTMTLSMSMFFRLFASMTKTLAQALAPSSIVLLILVLYTGFAIPVKYMLGWASWIRWLNPVSYGFEALMVNEFNGRQFQCIDFIPSGPGYENVSIEQQACAVEGSVLGLDFVSGTAYVETSFNYQWNNRWRNFGIILAMTIGLFIAHLVMSELVASARSKGEVLVFTRSKIRSKSQYQGSDEETGAGSAHKDDRTVDSSDNSKHDVQKHASIYHWEAVNFEVQIKSETRKILDSVDGWIKPGTLTALMVRLSYRKNFAICLTLPPRAFPEQVKLRFSMFLQAEQRLALSQARCL